MNLAQTLAELSEVKKGPQCKLGGWLSALEAQQRNDIEEAFGDQRVLHRVLAEWITSQDGAPKITASNISHHRTGACAGCKHAGFNLTRQ